MMSIDTDYSKHTRLGQKIKWRPEHLGALGTMGETTYHCCYQYYTEGGITQSLSCACYIYNYLDEPNSRPKRETHKSRRSGRSSETGGEFIVESLVVADKKMVEFHGIDQLKTYVPSQINMVS